MEGLFANSGELKGKMKENVEASEKIGLLCKKLVTIITDVPIHFNVEDMLLTPKDEQKITDLFEELEFRNLLQRILGNSPAQKQAVKKPSLKLEIELNTNSQFNLFDKQLKIDEKEVLISNYKLITQENKLISLVNTISESGRFAFQLITDTKDALTTKLVGISFVCNNSEGFYIPFLTKNLSTFKIIFENKNIEKIGFDLKFAVKVLYSKGLVITGNLFDVEVSHYLLHPDMRHSLELVAENYLGKSILDEGDVLGKGKNKIFFSSLDPSNIVDFASWASCKYFYFVFRIFQFENYRNTFRFSYPIFLDFFY
jgi:DNA polymerase-1